MATITVDDIPRKVEDAFYTAVGLGVLGFQQVQVQQQQLKRSLSGSFDDACGLVRMARRRMAELIERQN